MRRVLLVALVVVAAPVAGQPDTSYTPLPSITLPPPLDRVLRDYERAWSAGDEAALAALFTADGFVGSWDGWLRGTDAIIARYGVAAGGPLRLRALAWATAGDVGYIVGAYGYGEADTWEDRGKFVLALRRDGNRWLIAADLDNSNRQ